MKKIFALLLVVFLVSILIGCEEEFDDDLNQAQSCLDEANTSSDASGCLKYLEGKSGKEAGKIRCGIYFLINGLTQEIMINAYKQIETNQSTSAPVLVMANTLALGGAAPDTISLDAASNLISICSESSSPGLSLVANASYIGTLARLSAFTNCAGNADDIECGLDNLTAEQQGLLGSQANSIYSSRCTSSSTDEVCKCLASAGAGGDPATVGAALAAALKNESCGE